MLGLHLGLLIFKAGVMIRFMILLIGRFSVRLNLEVSVNMIIYRKHFA